MLLEIKPNSKHSFLNQASHCPVCKPFSYDVKLKWCYYSTCMAFKDCFQMAEISWAGICACKCRPHTATSLDEPQQRWE